MPHFMSFTTPSGEEMVIQSKKDFEQMSALAKLGEEQIEAEDIRSIKTRIASGEEEVFPHNVVKQLIEGQSPVRVYREFRGLTMTQLAQKAGLSQSLISEIEAGKKDGGMRAMKALAAALGTSIDDLIWDRE